MHIWSLDGNYYILTCHIVIVEKTTFKKSIEIKINHITLEIEHENESCEICDL